ncbi:hormone-sensitive lipase-like [Mya arenaria]|uniref:hormone-sensitive lipase-like n=1 Tax=Mya arenaria TaxID=6604 RepID=UPI0022DECB8D|nr:hormone-sensitive lipase-like [Mya arenaria]
MANTKTDSEPFGLCKNDADFLKYFHISLKDIRSLIISSIGYYQRGKSSIRSCYYTAFCVLLERTQVLEPLVIEIVPHLHLYDFSSEVQANGYRSFISIVNRCVIHLLQLCRHINVNKTSMLFRSSFYLKELEAYVETLGQLIACLGYLQKLMSVSVPGELFMDEGVGDDLLLQVEMLNTDCFYSRCLGLQFCESIKKALQAVMVVMATFSECYDEPSQVIQVASSLLNSGKYILDEDVRAKQVVDITRTADIKFCKAFWSIPESPILHQLRSFTFPHVEVSDVFTLPAENFELPLTDESGETAVITPPCAHTGPAPVSVRLISHAMREGMDVMRSRFRPKTGSSKKEVLPKSRSLLFHCHGGGFVAQSSQSHEDYLRLWSRQLEAPILSVDYSLAPEQPFPRALEETFYAYAWALNNHDKLGWTGERVCFAGDSAGGNLVVSTALRAVSYGIRVPDGILAAYPALLVQYTPSPARLMSMIDPLLPVGILTRCLAAYAGIADKFSSALAAPVFCNPGKVETWEVVKSSEAPLDNVINELANHNADDKFAESGQTEDTKKARDDCGHSAIGKEKVKGSCDSGDELSENDFIVYDCDGKEEERVRVSSNKENTVVNELVTGIEVCDNMNVDGVELVCDKGKSLPVNQLVAEDCVCDETIDDQKSDNLYHSCDKGPKHFASVDEFLSSLDSTARIEVESEKGHKLLERKPAELYAVCKEMLDDDVDDIADGAISPNMKEKLCQSLENICEQEMDVDDFADICKIDNPDSSVQKGNRDLSQSKSFENVTSMPLNNEQICYLQSPISKNRSAENEKIEGNLKGGKNERHKKQASVSDTSDSGINGDTDVDSGMEVQDAYIKLSRETVNDVGAEDGAKGVRSKMVAPQSGVMETRAKVSVQKSFENISQESKTSKSETVKHVDERKTKSNTPFAKKRHMSLDLPVTFHPGQKSGPPDNVLNSETPFSPQLYPGALSFTPKLFSVQRKIAQSPLQLFRQLPIVKNYYMSPLLAPDDLLLGLPEVHLAACHFDPLLDDSVTFAKKLKSLGKPVNLKVYDSLPHGFFNFSSSSTEAKQATDACLECMKRVLNVETEKSSDSH